MQRILKLIAGSLCARPRSFDRIWVIACERQDVLRLACASSVCLYHILCVMFYTSGAKI